MAKTENLKPFVAGQSGNPSGRPKIPAEVRELARALSVEAIETHASIMRDEQAPPAARGASANAILDRAWGKPTQPIDGDGDGGEIRVGVNVNWSDLDRAKALASLIARTKAMHGAGGE